jgi:hypothetical protein
MRNLIRYINKWKISIKKIAFIICAHFTPLEILSLQNVKDGVKIFFAHGLSGNRHHINVYRKMYKKFGVFYTNQHSIVDCPFVTFDFQDSKLFSVPSESMLFFRKIVRNFIRGNYKHSSLAQYNEISHIDREFSKLTKNNEKIVFLGVSRGASIFFTWQSIMPKKNIVAAVLESPFSSMNDIIEYLRNRLNIHMYVSQEFGQSMAEFFFKKYRRNGISPLQCVPLINKDVPILIVSSTSDLLVPWESSFALYKSLREHGHEKVHFLLLNQGRHAFLLRGNDGHIYEKVTHAFYKTYGLPHDPMLAKEGQERFLKTY